MGSDKTRALIGFAKLVVSLGAGYVLASIWVQAREGLDEWYVPYGAGIIVAAMVFFLLSKFSRGSES